MEAIVYRALYSLRYIFITGLIEQQPRYKLKRRNIKYCGISPSREMLVKKKKKMFQVNFSFFDSRESDARASRAKWHSGIPRA